MHDAPGRRSAHRSRWLALTAAFSSAQAPGPVWPWLAGFAAAVIALGAVVWFLLWRARH